MRLARELVMASSGAYKTYQKASLGLAVALLRIGFDFDSDLDGGAHRAIAPRQIDNALTSMT